MTQKLDPSGAPAEPHRNRPRSRRRLWAFRLLAFSLPFLFLLLLELALRLFGAGQDLSLVIRVPGHPLRLTHQLNDDVDRLYYGLSKLAGPETRRFDLPKPPNTFRIVFLGASTVIGFPYLPEVAFPRQMEVLLTRQDPDTRFEVLNAGIVSINSFAVADLARQAVDCDPDLIVIHSGHNEFYGPGGPASSALSLPPQWIRATYLLRRLRIVQLLTALASSPPVEDDLLNLLPRTFEIPAGGPVYQQAESNLKENLERAVKTCRDAGIPVIVSTVASNIRSQSPLRAIWPSDADEHRRTEWEQLVEQGESALNSGQLDAALKLFARAEAICANHARLQFRKAQCLEQLNRPHEARDAYIRARDEDACRFRAPSSFSKITQQVAEAARAKANGSSDRSKGSQVVFLDIDAELRKVADPAGPGNDLYLEHVHYNAQGHRQLALLFARCCENQIRDRPWDDKRIPSSAELDELLGLVPEDDLAAESFTKQVYGTAPFRTCLDLKSEDHRAAEAIARMYQGLPKERREAFADLPMNIMAQDLVLPLAELHLSRKNADLARLFAGKALLRRPWMPEVHLLSARIRDREDDLKGAREALKTALELRPEWPPAADYLRTLPSP
jgi:Flp pilus assembly protein TadD